MNTNEPVESMAEGFELPKVYARDLVDRVLEKVTEAANEGEVAIHGFGQFKAVEQGTRKGRHPQTGEAVEIAARKVLKIETATAMKEGLDTKRGGRRTGAGLQSAALPGKAAKNQRIGVARPTGLEPVFSP